MNFSKEQIPHLPFRFLKEMGVLNQFIESCIKSSSLSRGFLMNKENAPYMFIDRAFLWSTTGYENLWRSLYRMMGNDSFNSVFKGDTIDKLRNRLKEKLHGL